jgi:hypothetical protein
MSYCRRRGGLRAECYPQMYILSMPSYRLNAYQRLSCCILGRKSEAEVCFSTMAFSHSRKKISRVGGDDRVNCDRAGCDRNRGRQSNRFLPVDADSA